MLFLATALAGFAYVLSPGPAFLAVLSLAAADGRPAAIRFMVGHLAGDLLWTALAMAALVGSNQLGPHLFDLLGLGCGLYLVVLGFKALRAPRGEAPTVLGDRRPGRTGLMFGITNPKAYPVATAMFTAIALPFAHTLTWIDAPKLLVAAFFGFLAADALLVSAAGLPAVRHGFRRYQLPITRCIGVLFVMFGLRTLWSSGGGLASRS